MDSKFPRLYGTTKCRFSHDIVRINVLSYNYI